MGYSWLLSQPHWYTLDIASSDSSTSADYRAGVGRTLVAWKTSVPSYTRRLDRKRVSYSNSDNNGTVSSLPFQPDDANPTAICLLNCMDRTGPLRHASKEMGGRQRNVWLGQSLGDIHFDDRCPLTKLLTVVYNVCALQTKLLSIGWRPMASRNIRLPAERNLSGLYELPENTLKGLVTVQPKQLSQTDRVTNTFHQMNNCFLWGTTIHESYTNNSFCFSADFVCYWQNNTRKQ